MSNYVDIPFLVPADIQAMLNSSSELRWALLKDLNEIDPDFYQFRLVGEGAPGVVLRMFIKHGGVEQYALGVLRTHHERLHKAMHGHKPISDKGLQDLRRQLELGGHQSYDWTVVQALVNRIDNQEVCDVS